MKNSQYFGISSLVLFTQAASAGTVKDIQKVVTDLLSHEPEVTSLSVADQKGLKIAGAKFQPWTGSFWPDINGGIANHYRKYSKRVRSLIF